MPKDAWPQTKGYSLYLKIWLFFNIFSLFTAATIRTPELCMKSGRIHSGRMIISTYPLHFTLSPPSQDIMECVQKSALWVLSKCSPKPSVHTLPSFNKQMSADSEQVCVHLCSRGPEIQMSLLWTITKDLLHPFKDWLYKGVFIYLGAF